MILCVMSFYVDKLLYVCSGNCLCVAETIASSGKKGTHCVHNLKVSTRQIRS